MSLLQPMRREAFERFRELSIATYASDNVAARGWPGESALARARAELESLLPGGQDTGGHLLFELCPAEVHEPVGYLWLGAPSKDGQGVAHVYWIHVFEAYRRRGYARAALLEAEDVARRAGHRALSLNVFANNGAARILYESLGYAPQRFHMIKVLS